MANPTRCPVPSRGCGCLAPIVMIWPRWRSTRLPEPCPTGRPLRRSRGWRRRSSLAKAGNIWARREERSQPGNPAGDESSGLEQHSALSNENLDLGTRGFGLARVPERGDHHRRSAGGHDLDDAEVVVGDDLPERGLDSQTDLELLVHQGPDQEGTAHGLADSR